MPALTYSRFNDARAHLKDLLDAAEAGRPASVARSEQSTVLVDRERFLQQLRLVNARRVELVAEDGGWVALVRDAPVAADGDTVEEAIGEVIVALREYAEDWSDRLHLAPNHGANWGLVQLVDHSTDDELRDWILGTGE
ncbi:MAG: prevent-host-death protein [Actinomycetota bacterium]|nr:prevent-host-death protein [Actinomycetota bacterium]